MASRIRELKDQLVEQTGTITSMQHERAETNEVVKSFYLALVKYKPEFSKMTSTYADVEFPNLRAEAAQRETTAVLMKNSLSGFGALVEAMNKMHAELAEVYRELDQSVDEAMLNWQTVRAQEKSHAKASTFRADSPFTTTEKRAATPEVPLDDSSRVDSAVSTPTPVVNSTKKAEPKPAPKTEKKRSEKISDLLTPKPTSANTKK